MNDAVPKTPSKNVWRMLLALWFAWLAVMIVMSIKEWNTPRPPGGEADSRTTISG